MISINCEILKVAPNYFITLLALAYIYGFVSCQAPFYEDFGVLPYNNATYLHFGFVWLYRLLMFTLAGLLISILLKRLLDFILDIVLKKYNTLPEISLKGLAYSIVFLVIIIYIAYTFSKFPEINYLITTILVVILMFFIAIAYQSKIGYDKTVQTIYILLLFVFLATIPIFEIVYNPNHDSKILTYDVLLNNNQQPIIVDVILISNDYVFGYKIDNDQKSPIVINKDSIELLLR